MPQDCIIYGFVYYWRDRKRKMFYIGSHMGTEDDGYICSSRRMRAAYKKRPGDFRRRVLWRLYVKDKFLLFSMEQAWLNLIKETDLGTRSYNLKKSACGGKTNTPAKMSEIALLHWSDPVQRERHVASLIKNNQRPERCKAHSDKMKDVWASGRMSTRKMNVTEKSIKARQAGFRKSERTKITPDDVRFIRSSDMSTQKLANKYGVTYQNIRSIRLRHTWTDIE